MKMPHTDNGMRINVNPRQRACRTVGHVQSTHRECDDEYARDTNIRTMPQLDPVCPEESPAADTRSNPRRWVRRV